VTSESDKLLTEASIWLARIERGLQAQEGALLREWLRDPAHRDAIVDAAKLYHGPDIVAVLAEMVPVGFGAPPPPKPRPYRPKALNVCLGVVLLVASFSPIALVHRTMPGVLDSVYPRSSPWGEAFYTAQAAQTRDVKLLDGTHVILHGLSKLGVLYGPAMRFATLDYGEALFRVVNEPNRPFEISAGGRRFRAPPSKFDVRVINPQSVELTVLDGGVTVQGLPWRWPQTPAEARLFDPSVFDDTTVGPMQAAVVENTMITRYPITAANVRTRLNWEPAEVLYVTP
jgi:transmembrane sensor